MSQLVFKTKNIETDYTNIKVIGKGKNGEVHLYNKNGTNEVYAVKVHFKN